MAAERSIKQTPHEEKFSRSASVPIFLYCVTSRRVRALRKCAVVLPAAVRQPYEETHRLSLCINSGTQKKKDDETSASEQRWVFLLIKHLNVASALKAG